MMISEILMVTAGFTLTGLFCMFIYWFLGIL